VQSIQFFTNEVGLGEAMAIILFTLIAGLILMPINLLAMANMYRNKKTLSALKPELDNLKIIHKGNPSEIAKSTMALYKKHKIKLSIKMGLLISPAKFFWFWHVPSSSTDNI